MFRILRILNMFRILIILGMFRILRILNMFEGEKIREGSKKSFRYFSPKYRDVLKTRTQKNKDLKTKFFSPFF